MPPLKIAVRDPEVAIAFYPKAFDLRHEVTWRTDEEDHSTFLSGDYGEAAFCLSNWSQRAISTARVHPPSASRVDDPDDRHGEALAAGGAEAVAPCSPQGTPRCSAVKAPSRNGIWLYQG